ncbi:MAG: ABC transporter ATP-binding protein/permease [Bacilli bacterium]|nr:ABC transporter ATP-binding protein/permease [Bacilli bacterium]
MPPVRIKERAKAKKGTMKRLLKMLFKHYPWHLIVSLICLILNVITNLSSSIFVSLAVNALTAAGVQGTNPFIEKFEVSSTFGFVIETNVTYLVIVLACIYVVGIFAIWWWNRTMAIVTQKFLNTLRKEMFNHMQDLPIKYFDTHAHGAIMSLYTNDIDTIRQFISQALPSLVQTGLISLLVFIVMLSASVWMTLVVVVGLIVMTIVVKKIGGKSSKFFIKQQEALGRVEGNIEESIKGLKVIKVFSHEEKSSEDFDALNNELKDYATTANIHGNIMMPINGNIGNFLYILCGLMGAFIYIFGWRNLSLTGFEVIKGDTARFAGMISLFLMQSRMFANNVNQFSQQIIFIVMGMAGASRCLDLLDEKPEVDNGYVYLCNVKEKEDGTLEETEERTRKFAWKHQHGDGTLEYVPLKGHIVLDHVDFSYDGKKLVLEDVSIYAKPGQKIAFVGATGAGKTTITNLINRFYDIADGKIRYDGININKIKKADLRRSLGIVLQDTNLFTGTVMDNIRYGRLDATDEECIEAAKIANAHDFITRLPDGYNTMLSGDGGNLSQGQRQLLSIARAAVADAPVMILDEATSSIDTRTEKLVQQGTDKLMEGRTVFVIAHRLSTVQNSKAIMVLDHGHIIERGNHDDLIKQKGMYYNLYTGAFELE